jgi:hypothetical protein
MKKKMQPSPMQAALRRELMEALRNIELPWELFDKHLQDYLDRSDCWLLFDSGKAMALVGIGEGDAARGFDLKIKIETGAGDDVDDQIAGIDELISRLNEAKKELEGSRRA